MIKLKDILKESEIDPDIEGQPFDDNDIYHGSDIAGIKSGGTGMPHGFGFPNNPFSRRRKMRREDLRKILYITSIDGVPGVNISKNNTTEKLQTMKFIKAKMPWGIHFWLQEQRLLQSRRNDVSI